MNNKLLWEKYSKEKNPAQKQKLRNELIEKYVDLVKIVSGKLFTYYARKIEYDDLVGYGIIGLIDAIDRFDTSKNIKFETYASIRIRGSIMDQIRSLDWVPRSVRQKSKTLSNATSYLEDKYGRAPTQEELAKHMNITLQQLNELVDESTTYNIISVEDELIGSIKYDLHDERTGHLPEENMMVQDTIDSLAKAIDTLKDREKLIINLYYYENLTYREISEVVEVSESRISQIVSGALEKLRDIVKDDN